MTETQGSWGGARSGAGNPEFKPKWKSGKTMVIRVPEAIADEVLVVARQIDEGESVTLSNGRSETKELYQKAGELEAELFKARQELRQVTQERDEYFERVSDIQLELDNLKDNHVTQSSSTGSPDNSPDPAAILNRLRKERKKSKADLKDVELIIELMQAIAL